MRHPYQVRRLRSVFGSGRACRNSCDFRTAVTPAAPAPGVKPFAAPGPAPGAAPAAMPTAAPGAAQAARHSQPVTRGTQHRATPVCTVPARPRLLLPSPHGHRGRATASPAFYHAQPTNPTFLPHYPVPATPNSPAPPPGSRRRFPWNAMKPRIHCVPTPWIPGFTASCVRRPARCILPPASCLRRPARYVRQQAAPPPTPRNPPVRTRVPTERTLNPNANRAQPPNSRQTFSHSR